MSGELCKFDTHSSGLEGPTLENPVAFRLPEPEHLPLTAAEMRHSSTPHRKAQEHPRHVGAVSHVDR